MSKWISCAYFTFLGALQFEVATYFLFRIFAVAHRTDFAALHLHRDDRFQEFRHDSYLIQVFAPFSGLERLLLILEWDLVDLEEA